MVHASYLSPLHDYTDLPFRLLCRRYGADSSCVPLVNATAVCRNPGMLAGIDAHPDEGSGGIQLVGNEPAEIGMACRLIAERFRFAQWFNLNCGCPSERTRESGGGSALLVQPEKMAAMVGELKNATDRPVSIKLRLKENAAQTAGLCRLLEKAGADFIILHGRTPSQGYSGKADWEAIRHVREHIGIPLVGNGDIKSAAEGRELVAQGYCDSFMVGREAMANPMLFSDRKPGPGGRARLLHEYAEFHRRYRGEPRLKDVKLKAISLFSGIRNATSIRNSIMRAAGVDEILAIQDD